VPVPALVPPAAAAAAAAVVMVALHLCAVQAQPQLRQEACSRQEEAQHQQ